MTVCPLCGLDSEGRFFCDRCGGLLPFSMPFRLPDQVQLADGRTVDCRCFQGQFPVDGQSYRESTIQGVPVRLYAFNSGWWNDLGESIRQRETLSGSGLSRIEVVKIDAGALVVAWGLREPEFPLLSQSPSEPFARLRDTLSACRLLSRVLSHWHAQGLCWPNFDPAGLRIQGDEIEIQSLDLLSPCRGAYPAGLRIPPAFIAPEITYAMSEGIGIATNVYHVALYAYYRLAGLLPQGFLGEGPAAFAHDLPALRLFAPNLPIGIAEVVERGLELLPNDRPSSVDEFVETLEQAIRRACDREQARTTVHLETASSTSIGRSHLHSGLPNQDAHAVLHLPDGTLVAVVADGVTSVRIGSGDQASNIVIDCLSKELTRLLPGAQEFAAVAEIITEVCYTASQEILNAAIGLCQNPMELLFSEVMCSTLVLAIVRGNELITACLGDSRIYLLAENKVEQLTVDGDVRSVHLAAGCPPEQIAELGSDAYSLFCCLGVVDQDESGRIVPDRERSRPTVRRWSLLPGDLVVLCSDGLIEEGVFLEPEELARLAGEFPTVEELADGLVRAAEERQRDPSPEEPVGFGDDITCVLIRVAADQSSTGK